MNHTTGGRRHKGKGPAQPQMPNLPPIPAGDGSSDALVDEKEAKRPRSTSTNPKSGRGLELHECDRPHSVGSSSEDGVGKEVTLEEPFKRINRESPMTTI